LQADVVLQNLLRHFALSKNGEDLGGGLEPTGESTMNDDEREEWAELRTTVRQVQPPAPASGRVCCVRASLSAR
jgi:hypothetical protein